MSTHIGNVQNLQQIGDSLRFYCHACGQKLDATGLPPFTITSCPSCTERIIVPKWFGNYLLEQPVGRGGMATVYRAIELTLEREVAIKILDVDIINDAENTNLFLHEARTAATVNHRAVIPVYTCGIEEGRTYIAMQFMHGGSLEAKQEDATEYIPCKEVVQWIRDVAEGLRNALRVGVIHHDIKPGNIMLDADNNARIGDFGISGSSSSSVCNQAMLTTMASFVTPNYVSPERVMGLDEDERGDIYSLGATFYHLITHQPPFKHNDVYEVARMRLTVTPVPPIEIRSEIPSAVNNLIMGMMAVDPNARPTYDQIVDELNHVLADYQKGRYNGPKVIRKFSHGIPVSRTKVVKQSNANRSLYVGTFVLMIIIALMSFFAVKTLKAQELPTSSELIMIQPPKDANIYYLVDSLPEAKCPIPVMGSYLEKRLIPIKSRPIFSRTYTTLEPKYKEMYGYYVKKLEPAETEREFYITQQLPRLIPDLVAQMKIMPYDQSPIMVKSDNNPIKFQGATIAYSDYIAIPKTQTRRIRKKWTSLRPTDISKMMRYYANLRVEVGQTKQAAEAYFSTAIFQDYTGDYEGAAKSLNDALKLDPALTNVVHKVFGV